MFLVIFVLVAVCFSSAHCYTDEALADQITTLPGADNLDITFNQFSGYLSIPGTSGKFLINQLTVTVTYPVNVNATVFLVVVVTVVSSIVSATIID